VSVGAGGAQKGAGARGRASWLRIPASCASASALVHGGRWEGGVDRGGPRRRERGRAHGGNGWTTGKMGPQSRERRGARGQRNLRRQLGPTGHRAREREESAGQSGADRRGPPVRGGRRASAGAPARARAAGLVWAELAFSISLEFLIAFLFPFLYGFYF
jgi:hypothetical protein